MGCKLRMLGGIFLASHAAFGAGGLESAGAASHDTSFAGMFVTGLAKFGNRDFVYVVNHDTNQTYTLIAGEAAGPEGLALSSVQWAENPGDSVVKVAFGKEIRALPMDKAAFKNPLPPVMAAPLPAIIPYRKADGSASSPHKRVSALKAGPEKIISEALVVHGTPRNGQPFVSGEAVINASAVIAAGRSNNLSFEPGELPAPIPGPNIPIRASVVAASFEPGELPPAPMNPETLHASPTPPAPFEPGELPPAAQPAGAAPLDQAAKRKQPLEKTSHP